MFIAEPIDFHPSWCLIYLRPCASPHSAVYLFALRRLERCSRWTVDDIFSVHFPYLSLIPPVPKAPRPVLHVAQFSFEASLGTGLIFYRAAALPVAQRDGDYSSFILFIVYFPFYPSKLYPLPRQAKIPGREWHRT